MLASARSYWLGDPRRRRTLATGLSILAGTLLAGSVSFAAYPLYTDWRARGRQGDLAAKFASKALADAYRNGEIVAGEPLTRLLIPKLGVDILVVQGTSPEALHAGAGHYESTPLPGHLGNVAIAGHRNLHGKPFARIDELTARDRIVLITPVGKHVYEVVEPFEGHPNPWVTGPDDWSVIDATDEKSLTLTTCHPYGANAQRLVVRAALTAAVSP